jgi:deazaflavin-dependent oxidoreductase (nitroreductase family)
MIFGCRSAVPGIILREDPRHEEVQQMLFGQEHVEKYEETGGEEGHDWQNTTTLILETTGRKSGEARKTPLIYQEHDGDYLVVASKGGADDPPAWYLNLEAKPEVGVQVKDDKFKARARTATPDEKPEMWETMTATWPAYDDYQKKTDREIPVVVLERTG